MKLKTKGLMWLWIVLGIALMLEVTVLAQTYVTTDTIIARKFLDNEGNGEGGNDTAISGWWFGLYYENGTFVDSCHTPNCTWNSTTLISGERYLVKEQYDTGFNWIPTDTNYDTSNCPADQFEWGPILYSPGTELTPPNVTTDWYNWKASCEITNTTALEVCVGETIEFEVNLTNGTLPCTQLVQGHWFLADINAEIDRTDTSLTLLALSEGTGYVDYAASFPQSRRCDNRGEKQITIYETSANITEGTDPYCHWAEPGQLVGDPEGGNWSGQWVDAEGLFWPNATGSHNVTYTVADNVTGCVGEYNATIVVNPLPVLEFFLEPTEFCVGDPALPLEGQVIPDGGNWTSDPPGYIMNNGTYWFDPNTVGFPNVIYEVTNSTTGCMNSNTTMMTVYPLPVVSANGPYGPLCANWDPVPLNGTPAVEAPDLWTWSGPGLVNEDEFDPSIGPGTYNITYTVTNGTTGCFDEDTTQAEVVAPPEVPVDMETLICKGDSFILPSTVMVGDEELAVNWFEDGCQTDGSVLAGLEVKPVETTIYFGQTDDGLCQSNDCYEYEVKVRNCEPVPTLSQWGLITFGLLLAGSAAWFIRRRKRTN